MTISRRQFLSLLGASALTPVVGKIAPDFGSGPYGTPAYTTDFNAARSIWSQGSYGKWGSSIPFTVTSRNAVDEPKARLLEALMQRHEHDIHKALLRAMIEGQGSTRVVLTKGRSGGVSHHLRITHPDLYADIRRPPSARERWKMQYRMQRLQRRRELLERAKAGEAVFMPMKMHEEEFGLQFTGEVGYAESFSFHEMPKYEVLERPRQVSWSRAEDPTRWTP